MKDHLASETKGNTEGRMGCKDSGFRGWVGYMQADRELSLGQTEFEGLDMQLDGSSCGQPES